MIVVVRTLVAQSRPVKKMVSMALEKSEEAPGIAGVGTDGDARSI